MKKSVLLHLVFLPVFAFAQFPVPESFQITVNYILEGQSDWCDNHLISGPAYCNFFSWQTPDTANTPATLTGYRIYKDSMLFISTANTIADTAGGYMASFYVTATYENPAGESAPSNIVVISDLPMATHETNDAHQIGIWFDLPNQMLMIRGAGNARNLSVYDMGGMLVLSTAVVSEDLRLEGLAAGVYGVVVQDRYGGCYSKLILMGMR